MSLEEKIDKLTAVIEANTAAQMEVIGLAKSGDGDSKPKATKPKKADETKADTGTATTVPDSLKQGLSSWLGEFAKESDKDNPDGIHPEVIARKAALKKAFTDLGVKQLPEIAGIEKGVERITAWFEKVKAKGRFVPDPEPAADDDDGLGV
jgi:hypothetical protein